MIFVTVGVQLPFDRLVRAVDGWAATRGRRDVVAQVGATTYQPTAMEAYAFLKADEFARRVEAADLIVAHAGMGSIITAIELGKPLFILPRRAALGEHRNDHQLATAGRMAAQANVSLAQDEKVLVQMLDEFRAPRSSGRPSGASERLLCELSAFIHASSRRGRTGLDV
ncbi:glycosyltransferase [Phenylobacterium sp.]|jgi:UDP-N-acetylglucosamine transferase subunit ALG13|uniref:glycosyltransferase n=1 Tax=Phenylobacterium sp. TaxID=1871053 RepID=UPI0037832169